MQIRIMLCLTGIQVRLRGGMGAKYIVQNAHYDYNTPDMIVVSPTVLTSAKYDSEEGLSFVNCCYIRLAQKTHTLME
jgi:hypothetical protein